MNKSAPPRPFVVGERLTQAQVERLLGGMDSVLAAATLLRSTSKRTTIGLLGIWILGAISTLVDDRIALATWMLLPLLSVMALGIIAAVAVLVLDSVYDLLGDIARSDLRSQTKTRLTEWGIRFATQALLSPTRAARMLDELERA